MKKGNSEPLPPGLATELAALEARPVAKSGADDDAKVAEWHAGSERRGRFWRPRKVLKSLRIDADVLAFFEAQGPEYQTRINGALRAVMEAEQAR